MTQTRATHTHVTEGWPEPLYKVLGENLKPHHGGSGKWVVGRKRSVRDNLEPCSNGLHCVNSQQLIHWLGPKIHPVTAVSAEYVDGGDKLVFRSVTIGAELEAWNKRTARLFAADCAEYALRILKRDHDLSIPEARKAIRVARRFANGEAPRDDLSAAWSAAKSAAKSAAWSGAESAAWSAAESAAWSAAWSAAKSAAWSAAESAAWSAARSAAWSAAKSAAWSVAKSAAWSAARSAAKSWQAKRLNDYLTGKRG